MVAARLGRVNSGRLVENENVDRRLPSMSEIHNLWKVERLGSGPFIPDSLGRF